MQIKVCGRCKKELPIEQFYRHGKDKDGEIKYHSMCKTCTKLDNQEKGYARQKKYKTSDRERYLEQGKEYRESHKEQIRSYNKQRYDNNKEKVVAINNAWKVKNKEKVKEIRREYHRKNIDKMRIIKRTIQQRRTAIQNNLMSTYTSEDWLNCLTEFKHSCAYCGNKTETLHQEHVIPLSKGGAYVLKNIVPSCIKCNSSKHNNGFEEWYKKQDFFDEKRWHRICKWIGYDEKIKIQQLALC